MEDKDCSSHHMGHSGRTKAGDEDVVGRGYSSPRMGRWGHTTVEGSVGLHTSIGFLEDRTSTVYLLWFDLVARRLQPGRLDESGRPAWLGRPVVLGRPAGRG